MSRNLCKTSCDACPSPRVTLVEAPRPMTAEECGVYSTYVGMTVANAECPECGAKYVAWIRGGFRHHWSGGSVESDEAEYSDLSYRSSFNDEPGVADLPVYEVRRTVTYARVRRIARCPNGIDLDQSDHRDCYGCAWDARIRKAAEDGWWGVWWVYERAGRRARRPFFQGPFETREQAEAVRKDQYESRLAYYERRGRAEGSAPPSIDDVVVDRWTAENVEAGFYNPRPRSTT